MLDTLTVDIILYGVRFDKQIQFVCYSIVTKKMSQINTNHWKNWRKVRSASDGAKKRHT